jgi:CheY-like chemotaxis protein
VEEKKRILVIYDHEAFLRMFRKFLTDAGYEVQAVTTGETGVALAGREQFDLILIDYYLDRSGTVTAANFVPSLLKALPGVPITVITNLPPEDKPRKIPGAPGWVYMGASKGWWEKQFSAIISDEMARKRVLVVHDHEHFQEMFRQYLENDGYVVASALTGEDAVSMVRRSHFDLILIDYYLEKHGTVTALNYIPQLTTLAPGSRIAVITSLLPEEVKKIPPGVKFIPMEAAAEWWTKFPGILKQYLQCSGEQC